MSKPVRVAIAAVVALAAFAAVVWFDGVARDVQRAAGISFDPSWSLVVSALDGLLLGAAAVVVALAVWWARSAVAAIGFALVGVILAFVPAFTWTYGASINGAPAAISGPVMDVASWLLALYPFSVGSVSAICGAMVLASVAVLVAAGRGRIGGD